MPELAPTAPGLVLFRSSAPLSPRPQLCPPSFLFVTLNQMFLVSDTVSLHTRSLYCSLSYTVTHAFIPRKRRPSPSPAVCVAAKIAFLIYPTNPFDPRSSLLSSFRAGPPLHCFGKSSSGIAGWLISQCARSATSFPADRRQLTCRLATIRCNHIPSYSTS